MMGRLFLTLAIFLLSGSHAFADRFYAGADVIVTNIDYSEPGLSFHERPIGVRLLGGYAFSKNFAIEGSYVETGEADETVVLGGIEQGLTAEMTGYVVSLVLQTDMTTPNLFTKLGYHDSEVDISAQGIDINQDEDGFAAAVGFRHDVLYDGVAIRGQVELLESDIFDNVWSVGIGLEFSFGN